jgi:hypothetical protein
MKRTFGLLAVVSSCLLGGCAVSAEAGPVPEPVEVVGDGLLTVDWSVDGVADPDECDQSGAENLSVLVTTASGATVGEFVEYCDEFVMSIELAPGSYYADAVLLDSHDRERTTAVDLGYFEIYGDDELSVSIDFPASSFY